jgi:D-alanyl-D-alanine dipeptidase
MCLLCYHHFLDLVTTPVQFHFSQTLTQSVDKLLVKAMSAEAFTFMSSEFWFYVSII